VKTDCGLGSSVSSGPWLGPRRIDRAGARPGHERREPQHRRQRLALRDRHEVVVLVVQQQRLRRQARAQVIGVRAAVVAGAGWAAGRRDDAADVTAS
jgi:hypothetical protein